MQCVFKQNFKNWTSGNNNIDKFIQDNQLSTHEFYELNNVLEWIPYDRFYDIKYISKNEFELAIKIKIKYEFYGMTQDPETKNYMMVLNNKCKKCNKICNAIYFQQKFIDWTSNNDDIDKFIQATQLSAHDDVRGVLEWIPYDRFYDVKYISKDDFGEMYIADWSDGI
ncbi:unnamed protein product [Rhizophagus irregularis]|nr:unnamed protein product [Rhizophagus irregularis]